MEPAFNHRFFFLEKYSAPCAWQASSTTINLYGAREFQDRVHIGHLAVQVNRHDRGDGFAIVLWT